MYMEEQDNEVYADLNIRQFKLTSGEDIIGLIAGVDKKTAFILMERPLSLVHEILNDDQASIYFADWMPVSKSDVVQISPGHIVSQAEVNDKLKKAYIKWCLNYSKDDITSIHDYTDIGDDDSSALDYASIKVDSKTKH